MTIQIMLPVALYVKIVNDWFRDISTHTPLAGRDVLLCLYAGLRRISTHTPLAGRDFDNFHYKSLNSISTHTPLAGRDPASLGKKKKRSGFQLTRPSRGVTYMEVIKASMTPISTHTPLAGRDHVMVLTDTPPLFQLTRPSRGVTEYNVPQLLAPSISTHTPLAGRDTYNHLLFLEILNFNSHAPRGA